MNDQPDVDRLENRGFEFLRREQWSDARHCFEEMRQHRLPPLREAKVLANIMTTLEKEGRSEEGISVGREAIRILEMAGTVKTTEGAELAGTLRGRFQRLSGVQRAEVLLEAAARLVPIDVAYFFAAWVGAYIGREYDLKDVGPVVGAADGYFFLSRWFSITLGLRQRPRLAFLGALVALTVLFSATIPGHGWRGVVLFVSLCFVRGVFWAKLIAAHFGNP